MLTAMRRRGLIRPVGSLLAMLAGLQAVLLGLAGPAGADTARSSELWVLQALNVQSAWNISQGQGVTVAVIDSGVNASVSDLVGSVRSGPDLSGLPTPESNQFWGVHGTWMASLIVGHGHGPGQSDGIIGVAPRARVLSIRVIADQGDPQFDVYEHESGSSGQRELAHAIIYAVSQRVGVISLSLGYAQQSLVVRRALQDAYEHNVVVVASAGNSGAEPAADGQAPYAFPADYPGVLGVAAVNQAGQPASFSSQNLSVQVAAPGFNVPAQGRDGIYWLVSGTSPACALTAGVAALIKSRYPTLTDAEVISAITTSTTRSSRPRGGWNDEVGFGEVNAGAALSAAGRMARSQESAPALAADAHFGGGLAAIPPLPVRPRGVWPLVLYCLLGAAGLALVAVATSRLFALRDTVPEVVSPANAPATDPVPRLAAGVPGRHAVGQGHVQDGTDQRTDTDQDLVRYRPEDLAGENGGGL